MNATWTEVLTISLPLAAPLIGIGAVGLTMLSGYLKVRTHNALLVRLSDAAASAAGQVAVQMSALPAGTNLADARSVLVGASVAAMKSEFAGTLSQLPAVSDETLHAKVIGQLGSNPLHTALAGPTTVTATTVAQGDVSRTVAVNAPAATV